MHNTTISQWICHLSCCQKHNYLHEPDLSISVMAFYVNLNFYVA